MTSGARPDSTFVIYCISTVRCSLIGCNCCCGAQRTWVYTGGCFVLICSCGAHMGFAKRSPRMTTMLYFIGIPVKRRGWGWNCGCGSWPVRVSLRFAPVQLCSCGLCWGLHTRASAKLCHTRACREEASHLQDLLKGFFVAKSLANPQEGSKCCDIAFRKKELCDVHEREHTGATP
jgi:hypothetical protein